jgi:hypothetical protein
MNSEDQIHYKQILIDCLFNLLGWKRNLESAQPNRKRKDCNDIESIQSLRFWYKSYLNGLQLLEWIQ